jgi:hypothetical protein
VHGLEYINIWGFQTEFMQSDSKFCKIIENSSQLLPSLLTPKIACVIALMAFEVKSRVFRALNVADKYDLPEKFDKTPGCREIHSELKLINDCHFEVKKGLDLKIFMMIDLNKNYIQP